MSGLKAIDAGAQVGDGQREIAQQTGDAHGRHLDAYPERLFAPDMAVIYRVGLKRFYKLAAEGAFDFAVIKPAVGRQSWARERVRLHLNGELRGLTGKR